MVGVNILSRTALVLAVFLTIQSTVEASPQAGTRSPGRYQRRRQEGDRSRDYVRPRRRVRKNNLKVQKADFVDLDSIILNAPLPVNSPRQYREVQPRRVTRKTVRPRIRTVDPGIIQMPIQRLPELTQVAASPQVQRLPQNFLRGERQRPRLNVRKAPETAFLNHAGDSRPSVTFQSNEVPSMDSYQPLARGPAASQFATVQEYPPFNIPYSEPFGEPQFHPHHQYEEQQPSVQPSSRNDIEQLQPIRLNRPKISEEHFRDFQRKQEESLQQYKSVEVPQKEPVRYQEEKPIKKVPFRENLTKNKNKVSSPFASRKKIEQLPKKELADIHEKKPSFENFRDQKPAVKRRPTYSEAKDSLRRPSIKTPKEPVRQQSYTKSQESPRFSIYTESEDSLGGQVYTKSQESVRRPIYTEPEERIRKPTYTEPINSPSFERTYEPVDHMSFERVHKPQETPKYRKTQNKKRSSAPKKTPILLEPVYDQDYDPSAEDEHLEPFSRSFEGGDNIEKRQAFNGHEGYTDPNGIAFAENAAHAEHAHGGDGRLTFQLHGQKGPHSYRFGFDTGKGPHRQFRYEEKANDGTVKGRYGYYDSKGKLQIYNYSAHPHHGYSAVEAH